MKKSLLKDCKIILLGCTLGAFAAAASIFAGALLEMRESKKAIIPQEEIAETEKQPKCRLCRKIAKKVNKTTETENN